MLNDSEKIIDVMWKDGRNFYDITREVYLQQKGISRKDITDSIINDFQISKIKIETLIMSYKNLENRLTWHTAREKMRRGFEKDNGWKIIRDGVIKKFNNMCPITGDRPMSLQVHHINGCYKDNSSENLIPLSIYLHRVVHGGFSFSHRKMNLKRMKGFEVLSLDGSIKGGKKYFLLVAGYITYLRKNGYPFAGLFKDLDGLYRIDLKMGSFDWEHFGIEFLELSTPAKPTIILKYSIRDTRPAQFPVGSSVLGREHLSYEKRIDVFMKKFYSGLELKKFLRLIDYYGIPRVIVFNMVNSGNLIFKNVKRKSGVKKRILHPKWPEYKRQKKRD